MATETHEISRDKSTGTVMVTILNDGISIQKADSIARGMFVCPVRVFETVTNKNEPGVTETVTIRNYRAIGWLS